MVEEKKAAWQGRKEAQGGQVSSRVTQQEDAEPGEAWRFLLSGHQAQTSPAGPHQPPSQQQT